MHRKRLEKILKIFKRVPPTQFNMDTWFEQRGCKTVGCAIGHACRNRSIREAGLKLELDDFNLFDGHKEYQVVFGYKVGIVAVAAFLDIYVGDADYLFLSSSYTAANKRRVISRIRQFLREEGD